MKDQMLIKNLKDIDNNFFYYNSFFNSLLINLTNNNEIIYYVYFLYKFNLNIKSNWYANYFEESKIILIRIIKWFVEKL